MLTNVITGIPRIRQTSKSFRVLSSTPLAASRTIRAESAA